MVFRQPFEKDFPITQYFGKTEYSDNHTGIDYGCPPNTPILASESGEVIYAGWRNGGYGNCVFILHPDGKTTIYEHLNKVSVSVGQKVEKSQIIGYSGSTGNSTGPHLHFEIRDTEGKPFNPMFVLHTEEDAAVIGKPEQPPLHGADMLGPDVEVVAPLGAWGWSQNFEVRATVYPYGTKLHFAGRTTQRLGYTYCECYPEPAKYWVAVNDGETQILDNQEK